MFYSSFLLSWVLFYWLEDEELPLLTATLSDGRDLGRFPLVAECGWTADFYELSSSSSFWIVFSDIFVYTSTSGWLWVTGATFSTALTSYTSYTSFTSTTSLTSFTYAVLAAAFVALGAVGFWSLTAAFYSSRELITPLLVLLRAGMLFL